LKTKGHHASNLPNCEGSVKRNLWLWLLAMVSGALVGAYGLINLLEYFT
jgi:hypothetical protein